MIPGVHEGFTCPIIKNTDENELKGYKIVETDPPVVIMDFQTHQKMLHAYRNNCRTCPLLRYCQPKAVQGRKKKTLTANNEQFLRKEEIIEYFPEQ